MPTGTIKPAAHVSVLVTATTVLAAPTAGLREYLSITNIGAYAVYITSDGTTPTTSLGEYVGPGQNYAPRVVPQGLVQGIADGGTSICTVNYSHPAE